MYGADGEFNLKFVSNDGIFEEVYNKNEVLLTSLNDVVNMGIYNYADPEKHMAQHGLYDVAPYYLWGNIPGIPKLGENAGDNLVNFKNNELAITNYNKVYKQMNYK